MKLPSGAASFATQWLMFLTNRYQTASKLTSSPDSSFSLKLSLMLSTHLRFGLPFILHWTYITLLAFTRHSTSRYMSLPLFNLLSTPSWIFMPMSMWSHTPISAPSFPPHSNPQDCVIFTAHVSATPPQFWSEFLTFGVHCPVTSMFSNYYIFRCLSLHMA